MNKKRIEINRFDYCNNKNEISCDKFFNYYPTDKLVGSFGFENAK